jgi:hypothetical protein
LIAAPETVVEVLKEKYGVPYWTVPKPAPLLLVLRLLSTSSLFAGSSCGFEYLKENGSSTWIT